MAGEFERLVKEVEEMGNVVEASKKVIETLKNEIRANAYNPTAMIALADKLDAMQGDLSNAIATGTAADDDVAPSPADTASGAGGNDTVSPSPGSTTVA